MWHYAYDARNSLVEAWDETAGGTKLARQVYAFDVFGNRIERLCGNDASVRPQNALILVVLDEPHRRTLGLHPTFQHITLAGHHPKNGYPSLSDGNSVRTVSVLVTEAVGQAQIYFSNQLW